MYVPSFIDVGPAVSKSYGFENVDTARTDGLTDEYLTSFTARQHTDARYSNSVCLSVRPSVCPSVRNVPVSDENGSTYGSPSILVLSASNIFTKFRRGHPLLLLSFRAYSAGALLCPQYVAIRLQAVARPKFRGPRSASIARSQVWLGLPADRFQSGGTCPIHAAKARWWSSRGELRAIWPKSRRHLLVTR